MDMRGGDKLNALLICTDHWPGSLLGVEGHPVLQTPTIDELARTGVRFSQAYSECPVCIPARRTIMTGTSPRAHGDRVFHEDWEMPALPTLARTFRENGYQAYAVGKLHVFPQRDRIGFDDVLLAEEGRAMDGVVDDYEAYLADQGYAGKQFAHGMSNNQYVTRPWPLPEEHHITNWTTEQMERVIKRRDPKRPSFWYLSYSHPHPPLSPLPYYASLYEHLDLDEPFIGEWAQNPDELPFKLRKGWELGRWYSPAIVRSARAAFYALCTHIDHQIRRVIGTLREEGELDRTVIMFTSDHGDMLGTHGIWAKRCFYEGAARVPLVLSVPNTDPDTSLRDSHGCVVDDRLVGLQDVMPTLLEACGVPVPDSVEGRSVLGDEKRTYLYGEEGEGITASRMIRSQRHKLIYYPAGNRFQLFDLEEDPTESHDVAEDPAFRTVLDELTQALVGELYGADTDWLKNDRFEGLPQPEYAYRPLPGLFGQRGSHWPPPPATGQRIEDNKIL